MSAILVRFQFQDPNPVKTGDLVDLLKHAYGGAVSFVAEGTIFIDTLEKAQDVYDLLVPLFSYDDKLFVGTLADFQSLHHITRVNPVIKRIAI